MIVPTVAWPSPYPAGLPLPPSRRGTKGEGHEKSAKNDKTANSIGTSRQQTLDHRQNFDKLQVFRASDDLRKEPHGL